MLVEKGYRLDIRRPVLGQPLPITLEDHAGAVVFGGPMSANDPDDFVKKEIDWIDVPLREKRPYLGICLGAQMLVRHLGGKVQSNADGSTEIGWYPLHPTEKGRLLMHWPRMVYHSTARASNCRAAPTSWPKAMPIRTRPSATTATPGGCSSMPN